MPECCNNCGGEFELAMGVVPILRCTNLTCQRELPATSLPKKDIHVLKKTITYTNLNGEQVTDEFCFHLSKADLFRIEANTQGGMEKYIRHIVSSGDNAKIFGMFEYFVKQSFGVKSDDGKRFIKTPSATDEFLQSEAYSALIDELSENTDAAAIFFNGIMPGGLNQTQTAGPHPSDTAGTPAPSQAEPLATEENPQKVLTRLEMIDLSTEELRQKLAAGYQIADN